MSSAVTQIHLVQPIADWELELREAGNFGANSCQVDHGRNHLLWRGLVADKYFYIIETMKSNEAIEALSALASEARLAVFRLLVQRGPEGYTPSQLHKRLNLPAPTLSFHLKGLAQAGLVASRRDGRHLYYSPNFEHMSALVGFLTDNCCSLAEKGCDTACRPLSTSVQRRKSA